MKPTDPRRIDPRVFAPNFAMRYTPPPTDTPNIEAPDPLAGDGPDDTGFSNIPDDPTPDLPPPSYGAPERFVDIPVEAKRRQQDGGGGVTSSGAFFSQYTDEDNDTWLQCGTVTGGHGGSKAIADYMVLDNGALPAGISAGDILYLRAACTATTADGILLPGCALTGASTSLQTGSTVPDNHAFTVADPTGYIYTEIGRWNSAAFLPSAPGNVLAGGCIGNFALTRV